ncbi:MAG: N-formylglutamate amidohydrolase [Oscillospiraceae bacterium]|jgi:N-formylglutamate amidohydrolase|nr:N-formylglutamate amidohydrolase [Oscillospiraceae bacterium]
MSKDYGFVVVHVPHASITIPEEYGASIVLSKERLWREMRRMTDAFCDDLYETPEFPVRVVAKYSRFVCDVERFRDDKLESRAKFGQGLMYTHTTFGKRLRLYDEKLREKILHEVYDPHHERLTAAVENALEHYGKCLVIDGHSFPSLTPIKPLGIFSRPDFDIGTDSFHTPDALCDVLCNKVKELGYSVKVNTPFGGAITPMKYYQKDKRVYSVMFETNRRLYMNSSDMSKSADFEKTRDVCHALMRCAADWVFNNKS